MEDKYERFYCKNDNGRDLFYFELYFNHEPKLINWDISLDLIVLPPEVIDLVEQIIVIEISDEARHLLIDKLFNMIRVLPNIEPQYLPDHLLDKNGKFMDYYSRTLQELLCTKSFPDFVPFSESKNGYYFGYLLPIIMSQIEYIFPLLIEKIYFEELVKNNNDLTVEYAEVYSNNSKYLCVKLFNESTMYNCYIVMVNNAIKLFFLVEAK